MPDMFMYPATLHLRGVPTGELDEYNNEVFADTDVPVKCWYEPAVQSQDVVAKDMQVDAYTVYMPEGTNLKGLDAISIAPGRFVVEGPPAIQPGGFILPGHVRVLAGRVRG